MSLTKREGSPYYRYSFVIAGVRFTGTTERTSKRDALFVERERREEARRSIEAGPKPHAMTLNEAWGRYWIEVGQHATDARQVRWTGFWLIKHLGADKPIKDIGNEDVARLVGIRRLEPRDNVMQNRKREKARKAGKRAPDIAIKLVSQSTVNRSVTEPLKRVLKRAHELWGEHVQAIRWKDHMLGEPDERVRYMTLDEETVVFSVLALNYQRLVLFAQVAGCRATECVKLTWAEIDWAERRGVIEGKGRRGNKKIRYVPLSIVVRDMLWEMYGEARAFLVERFPHKTQDEIAIMLRRERIFRNESGEPATYRSYYAAFRTACGRAGVKNLKVHDLRHTAATRALRKSGNLRVAQKLLGHSNISTTAKYAHILDDDVRDALDALDQKPHHQSTPHGAKVLK